VGVEVVARVEEEDPALAARVGRLEDGGQAHGLERGATLGDRPHGGEARLRDPGVGEPAAHRDLVRHRVSRLRADAR
jgi:hypothetical protein